MNIKICLEIDSETGAPENILEEDFLFRQRLGENLSDLFSATLLKRVTVKLCPIIEGFYSEDDPQECLEASYFEYVEI